jgi:hypothetical protein
MTRMKRSTSGRRCAASQLCLGLFAFFFTANLKIRENGVGKMTLVYPAASVTTLEIEKRRYDSDTTRATGLRIDHGFARVRVAFQDVNRLSEAPEFRNATFRIEPGSDGRSRLHALVRAALAGGVVSDGLATIRVTLPGPVLESNAGQTGGAQARWAVPITRYFTEGIELEATYRSAARPPDGAEQQALNTATDR